VTPKLVLAMLLMIAVYWLFRDFNPQRMDKYFRRPQLFCSAGAEYATRTAGVTMQF
jgi:hypothetical protein